MSLAVAAERREYASRDYIDDNDNIDVIIDDGGGGAFGGGEGSSSSSSGNIRDDISTDERNTSNRRTGTTNTAETVTITTDDGKLYTGTVNHNTLSYSDGTEFEAYLFSPININSSSEDAGINVVAFIMQKLFGISDSDAKTFINAFKNISNKTSIFINNVSIENLVKTIKEDPTLTDSSKSTGYGLKFRPDKSEENIHNVWEISTTHGEISASFNVRFERAYLFYDTATEYLPNIQYTLKNYTGKNENNEDTLLNIRYNIINKPISVNIESTDIKNFLWFKVYSYYEIKSIIVRFDGTPDGINQTFCLYYKKDDEDDVSAINTDKILNGNDNEDSWKALHGTSSLNLNYTPDGPIIGYTGNGSAADTTMMTVIDESDFLLTEVNSEFYYEKETVLKRNTTTIKAYVPGLFNELVNYDSIEVFIQFEENKIETLTDAEAISTANAFQAYANTHCTLQYLNNTYKLHQKYDPENHNNDDLIAIFKLKANETSFNGSISVFYGNQIMYNEVYSTENSSEIVINTATLIKPDGNQYSDKVSLYYTLKKSDTELYVYVKKTKTGPNDNFFLHKFVSIYISDDDSSNTTDNENEITYISQDNVILHSVDVSIPQVSKGDSLVYIDESFTGKTRHYTYISNVKIGNTNAYYGVRAYAKINEDSTYEYFDNNVVNLGIDNLTYNVNAQIVKLTPYKEQQNIYSFANGEEYVLLNKESNHIDLTVEGGDVKELLNGTYALSYEYIVDGNPKRPQYVSTYAYVDYIPLNTIGIDNTYSYFSVEFSYITQEEGIKQVINISPNKLVGDTELYSYAFKQITSEDLSIITDDNIYKKVEEYVQIPAGNITLDQFKNIVKKSESDELVSYSEAKYYNYTTSTKKYRPYKYNEVKKYTSVPLNLYAKYIYYLKTSETIKDIEPYLDSEDDTIINPPRYYKLFEYVNTLDAKDFYQNVDDTYIHIKGIARDGSLDYHGYKYMPISYYSGTNEFNLNNSIPNSTYVYIKSKYISLVDYLKLHPNKTPYDLKGREFFRCTDTIDYINISNDGLTIYDIDTSGNTIYSTYQTIGSIISLNDIKTKLETIDPENYPLEDDILRAEDDELSTYKLNKFTVGNNNATLSYIVSFNGVYAPILFNDINVKAIIDAVNNNSSSEESSESEETNEDVTNIVILADNPVALKDESGDLFTYINTLKEYNTDDILFIPLFRRLSADDMLNDIAINNNDFKQITYYSDYKYFYPHDNTYTYVDTNTGEISGLTKYVKDYNTYIERYGRTYDIHMSINKQYFVNSSEKQISGKVEGTNNEIDIDFYNQIIRVDTNSHIVEYKDFNESQNSTELQDLINSLNNTYSFKFDTLTLFKQDVSYYSLSEIVDNLSELIQYTNTNYKESISNGESTYTDDIFIKTKFFYPSYMFNDGIHVDANGSYFTNVMGFDSTLGRTSKKIYLNNHIINIDKYSYTITMENDISIDESSLVNGNLSNYDYNKYYIKYLSNGKDVIENLNASSQPPSYWVTNSEAKKSYMLYKKVYTENTFKYDGIDKSQLTDAYGNPIVIKMNSSFYGLIFNDNLNTYTYSYFVTFDSGYDFLSSNGDKYLSQYKAQTYLWEFDYGDDFIDATHLANAMPDADITLDTEDINNILIQANNELYYNNYKDNEIKSCYYYSTYFTHQDYLYEIVPLTLFTFRNYNSDRSLLQYKDVVTHSIVTTKPFTIENPNEVKFTGTYTWIPPEYSTVVDNYGNKKLTIARDGYWKKDYVTEEKPLKISSYNFYPKDEISSINITYNFIPNSYVITAEISHPSISYDCLVGESREEIKYSYLINGFEYDYNAADGVSYYGGTYYGQIRMLDINDSYTNVKVRLYKKNTIINSSYVKKLEVQPAYVSYEYYTYKEATQLSNEKVPILYKTELIPAKKTKVQYWDKATNSYAIKSVISSYAYYAYSYTYETIPLQVASYIYSNGLNIHNFYELGTYLTHISYALADEIKIQSYAVSNLSYELSNIMSYDIKKEQEVANKGIITFSTYQNQINNTIKNFDINSSNSLSYLSSGLNNRLNNLTEREEHAINSLEKNVVSEILEQRNIIKDSLNDLNVTVNDKFNSFEKQYHNDVIGDASKEEKNVKWESITYTPIVEKRSGLVSGYSYSKQKGSNTITVGGDSLGEILQTTLGAVSSYTITKYNEDGSYTVSTYEGFNGLANILSNLSINRRIPNYKEFMVDLVPKMFSSIDFEGDYNIVYDINGNVKSKEKRNPTDIAKKCIMRADILWDELKKKNIVS